MLVPGRSYRIARIAGIPVGVSPWWLVIVGLITWTLGDSYFPSVVHNISPGLSYALGLASALLLFVSILLHEFGHALVARRHGIEVEEIDLWLLGGVSKMRDEAHDPDTELRYALAGPAVTAVIALLFAAISLALPASTSSVVRALIDYQLLVNVLILGFNLLPAFPLDGGRVLRSLLWRHNHDLERSTATAASVGRGFGYVMIGLGLLELLSGSPGGLWLALVGLFIVAAAGAQAVSAQVQATFSGVNARELMSAPVVSVPAELSLDRAGSDYFLPYRYTAFPVVDAAGHFSGVIAVDRVERVPPLERSSRIVADVADHDPALAIGEEEDVATLLTRPAFGRVGRAVVVDALGSPVGLLSITDIQRTLRAQRLAGGAARSPRGPSRVSSG
jgi:Zn-dependent protease/predicted transcriptional regulator